ncbi:NAD(P)-binding protein [Xylariaceae sp. FL0016]|nr:NAD(P)-binding protein [Xylariaceae sp. FL0016]
MPSLGNFIHTQFFLHIPKPSASFASKTVIVTGGNGGLGKETVKHIVRLDAEKVILACRSQLRGEEAKVEIESHTRCRPSVVEVWELDVESTSSIKSFVDRANALPRLDVLVNNAGIGTHNLKIVYDTEKSLAVNVVGTFLLALQLVPKLKETARSCRATPHMTFVGSALYDVAKYPKDHQGDIFAWFRDESHIHWMNQYGLSKLLQLYSVIKLSEIIKKTGESGSSPMVINSVDPCFCKTGLSGDAKGVVRIAGNIFRALTARTAEEGSRLIVQATSGGPVTHGLYMRAGAVQEYAPVVLDADRAAYVWESLCRKLEILQPGILQNIRSF